MDRVQQLLIGFIVSFTFIFTGINLILNKYFAYGIGMEEFSFRTGVGLILIFFGMCAFVYVLFLRQKMYKNQV